MSAGGAHLTFGTVVEDDAIGQQQPLKGVEDQNQLGQGPWPGANEAVSSVRDLIVALGPCRPRGMIADAVQRHIHRYPATAPHPNGLGLRLFASYHAREPNVAPTQSLERRIEIDQRSSGRVLSLSLSNHHSAAGSALTGCGRGLVQTASSTHC